jgi:hypothetical protein
MCPQSRKLLRGIAKSLHWNPAHPSVSVFLRLCRHHQRADSPVEFQKVPIMDASAAVDICMPHIEYPSRGQG